VGAGPTSASGSTRPTVPPNGDVAHDNFADDGKPSVRQGTFQVNIAPKQAQSRRGLGFIWVFFTSNDIFALEMWRFRHIAAHTEHNPAIISSGFGQSR
jgi:hypothetical protein